MEIYLHPLSTLVDFSNCMFCMFCMKIYIVFVYSNDN